MTIGISEQETAPAIRVTAARLALGQEFLFDGLDLELPAGLTSCLLGVSGVGKTSLLRLIAGLTHGASGTVGDPSGAPVTGRVADLAQDDLLRATWMLLGRPLSWRQRSQPQPVNQAQDLSEQRSWYDGF